MKRALGYTGECTEPGRTQETDLVQISEAAEAIDSEPVIYTPAGEVSTAPVESEPTVSFTA